MTGSTAKGDVLGFASTWDLLAAALPYAGLAAFALVVAGLVRQYRHHHGVNPTDN